MSLTDPDRGQETSKPHTEVSKRTLWDPKICEFIPNSTRLPLSTAKLTEAEARHQFQETIKTWWRTHPKLPDPAGVSLSAGKNEFVKAELRAEAAALQKGGVSCSEATWFTFTRMVLQDEADDAMTKRVIRTFAFQKSLKERAAFVVRQLIARSKLPQACFRDDFDLGNLSEGEREWWSRLSNITPLYTSQILPDDTLGGIYSLHIDWLSCVFNHAARIFKHLDLGDFAFELAAIYDFGEDWMDFGQCFPDLEENGDAMEEDLIP